MLACTSVSYRLILSGRKGAYLGQEELVYTTEWPHFTQYYNGQTGQGEGMWKELVPVIQAKPCCQPSMQSLLGADGLMWALVRHVLSLSPWASPPGPPPCSFLSSSVHTTRNRKLDKCMGTGLVPLAHAVFSNQIHSIYVMLYVTWFLRHIVAM